MKWRNPGEAERDSLPKLTYEEIESLNIPMSNK